MKRVIMLVATASAVSAIYLLLSNERDQRLGEAGRSEVLPAPLVQVPDRREATPPPHALEVTRDGSGGAKNQDLAPSAPVTRESKAESSKRDARRGAFGSANLPPSSADLMAYFFAKEAIPGIRSPVHEFHSALEQEPVDHGWAEASQAQLHLYLNGLRTDGWLDFPSVECRRTLCEIQVVSNYIGDLKPGGPGDWQTFSREMENQSWFRDLYTFPVLMVTPMPDGRVVYLNYFYRKGAKLADLLQRPQ